MQRADQNRQYRQMILDEIEPIITEITRLKNEIKHAANYGNRNIPVIESPFLMVDYYNGIGKKSAVFSVTDKSFKEKLKTMFGEAKYGS